MKKLNRYDYENIDNLKASRKPMANRVADVLLDKNIYKIDGYRSMVECVILLEQSLENSQKELSEYKLRYGKLK